MSPQPAPGDSHLERVTSRVRKLHARAVRGATEHEMASAARIMVQHLDTHRPNVRYCVAKGAEVRLLPKQAYDAPEARRLMRIATAPRAGYFREDQRVVDAAVTAKAISKHYLAFERYGYYIFVPLAALDIRV